MGTERITGRSLCGMMGEFPGTSNAEIFLKNTVWLQAQILFSKEMNILNTQKNTRTIDKRFEDHCDKFLCQWRWYTTQLETPQSPLENTGFWLSSSDGYLVEENCEYLPNKSVKSEVKHRNFVSVLRNFRTATRLAYYSKFYEYKLVPNTIFLENKEHRETLAKCW